MHRSNDDENAAGLGWEVVSVYDTRGFVTDAIVPAKGSKLKTPYEAAQHVLERAKAGDKNCQAALRQVAASNATRTTRKRKAK